MDDISAVDLFAGAGGFSLAAKKAGITVKAAVELDKDACDTYRKNFVDGVKGDCRERVYETDINTLQPESILADVGMEPGELDILMGGPPCQGYSRHRFKDQGVNDPRNKLLFRYFDFVSAFKPKVFIVENVPGLLWKRHESFLTRFFELADSSGYKVFSPEKINAKDFGVPQNRQRVFILGVRNDIRVDDLEWPPKPTHFSPKSLSKPVWKNASTVFEKPDSISLTQEIIKVIGRDEFDSLEFGSKLKSKDKNNIHMSHKDYMIERFIQTPIHGSREDCKFTLNCHSNGYKGHKDTYGRIYLNKPGPTMTTGCMNPSKGRFLHPWENHGITIRHAARFQTFPDDFYFSGGLISQARQIGNAVPIKLGVALLKQIKSFIRVKSLKVDKAVS